jgi:LemA protein
MHSLPTPCLTSIGALLLATSLTGCGYNDSQQLDMPSKSGSFEVPNPYQRRADLIPNIVATFNGEANSRQETLAQVLEARSKATSIQVTPEMVNDTKRHRVRSAARSANWWW